MSTIPKTHLVSGFETTGSYDVIKTLEVETPQITSPTDIIIKNKYAGVNFIDGYFRMGVYPSANKPHIFGREGSGVVTAVGDAVTKYKVGDNVAYMSPNAFAQHVKLPEDYIQILKLKNEASESDFKIYGGALLQSLTALTFITEAHEVKKDEFILVWAAAGGVGSILVQLASQRGAKVIAIASTTDKLEKAKELGAEYVINYKTEDVVARVKDITGGKGVAASFNSVGKSSFESSFESLARKGTLVSFGNASGVVPPFAINRLSAKNITLLRPQVFGYITEESEWKHYSTILREELDSGKLKFEISKVYPLKDYSQAAKDLESGATTGKLVIEIPQ
ncbi:hypothetical protein DFJ63DRAFT_289131 [Scheffersomyces coipomensis]|uniref:uncharacterized protein n=1 Tax=Scheffersomyces coipomensis TaxID=1788519 RepID=UPI00315CE4FD